MAINLSFSPSSGTQNPLEADLYAPQAQLADVENISATGNLNIGMVIDYDAHNASRMAGLAQFSDEYTAELPSPASRSALPPTSPNDAPQIAASNAVPTPQANYYGNTPPSPVQSTSYNPSPDTANAAQQAAPSAVAGLNGASGGSIPGGGSFVSTNNGGDVTNSYNTTANTTTITNNYIGNVTNNYYYGDNIIIDLPDIIFNGGNGGDYNLINNLFTTITNELTVVNYLTQDLVQNVIVTVDNTLEAVGFVVGNVTPIICNLTETLTGMLGGTLNAYDPLIDLDVIGLAGLGLNNGHDNNLLDLDILALAHGGTDATRDNDLIDLDVLGLANGGNTAGQDNDFIDLDLGLLNSASNAAQSDHDFIDADIGLLDAQSDTALSLQIDTSALSETLPVVGGFAENLLGDVPIISLDIPELSQDHSFVSSLIDNLPMMGSDPLLNDAISDLAALAPGVPLMNVIDGGNLFGGGAVDGAQGALSDAPVLLDAPPIVAHVFQGLLHHG